MTPWSVPVVTRPARQLGRVEARRMLRHPAYPVALLYPAVFGVDVITHDEVFTLANITYLLTFLSLFLVYAPVTFVAANRVAAATYRRGVRDTFDCTPVEDRQRTVALILGLLRGPVIVGSAGIAVLLVIQQFTIAGPPASNDAVHPRTALEYLQLPALVFGAGLLGIAVARWLPWPGALPLTALVLWLGTIAMTDMTHTDMVHGRTWFALWPVWVAGVHGMLPRQPLTQEMWHLLYLLGLGGLAGIAGLLRAEGPRRALWIGAGTTAALTALASWRQLG